MIPNLHDTINLSITQLQYFNENLVVLSTLYFVKFCYDPSRSYLHNILPEASISEK
jgi:hypothetical protein